VYLFAVYDSCADCDTPAGIDMARMKRTELKEYGWDKLPELDFNNRGEMVGIAVLHPRLLKKHLIESGMEEYELADAVDESFTAAVAATGKEYSPAVRKKAKRTKGSK
jgi:hypothetical protein